MRHVLTEWGLEKWKAVSGREMSVTGTPAANKIYFIRRSFSVK